MPSILSISRVSEARVRVTCPDKSVLYELSDRFTFEVPGAKFSPAYKWRQWDGKIRIFDLRNCQLPYGLHPRVQEFAEENGYECQYADDELGSLTDFSEDEAKRFFKYLNPHSQGEAIEVREHQIKPIIQAIRNRRLLILSPTSSGKSLVAYCLMRYYLQKTKGKFLIVVPTTALVEQMYKDFADYSSANGWLASDNCHIIYSGKEKEPPAGKRVIISTWQSVFRLPKSYFAPFETCFCDEVHLAVAKSLNGIMDNLVNCRYRFGATGTVQDSKTNVMQLEGMFGKLVKAITTKELMDKKMVADLTIKCLVLKYPEAACKALKKHTYEDEVGWLVTLEARNRFITNLALSMKGNTLILFQFTDKHGKPLHAMLKERCAADRDVFYVDKDVKTAVREEIRVKTEVATDAIIVASFGTFSTGVNIRNIDNIVFASMTKSKIRVLQSIGRGLRVSSRKTSVTLYDIIDDLQHKAHKNFALTHSEERVRYYNTEKFKIKSYKIALRVPDSAIPSLKTVHAQILEPVEAYLDNSIFHLSLPKTDEV